MKTEQSSPSIAKAASSAKKPKVEPKGSDDDDDDEVIGMKGKGKRKIASIIDSDSDSDYVNDENESDNSQSKMDVDVVPKRKKSAAKSETAKKKIKLDLDDSKVSFQDKLMANINESRSLSDVKEKDTTDIIDVPVVYRHQTLEFLKPKNIRDANKIRPNKPDYGPATLFVPKEYLYSLTPVNIHLFITKCTLHSVATL